MTAAMSSKSVRTYCNARGIVVDHENLRAIDVTRKKLHHLERLCEATQDEAVENTYARELTLRSLKRTIDQLKKELDSLRGQA